MMAGQGLEAFLFYFFLRLLPAVKNQESVCVVNSHVPLSLSLPEMLSLKALKKSSLTFSHLSCRWLLRWDSHQELSRVLTLVGNQRTVSLF